MANQINDNINNTRSMTAISAPRAPEPPQVPQTAATEFDQNTNPTRENFPTATTFREQCNRINFNRVLKMVQTRMFTANHNRGTFIRLVSNDLNNYSPIAVMEVKEFLQEQGYAITDIEDAAGNANGWKVSW